MRFETGQRHLLAVAVAGAMLAAASACGTAKPQASASSSPPVSAGDTKTVCDSVLKARTTALDALAPVSTALAGSQLSPRDVDKAADDVKAAFTAMHVDVASAAERANDPRLKATFAAYQLSVEQAIVVVEGADGDTTELAAAIDLPAPRDAEQAVIAACG